MDTKGKTISEKFRGLLTFLKSKSIQQNQIVPDAAESAPVLPSTIPLRSDELLRSVYGGVESEPHNFAEEEQHFDELKSAKFPVILPSKISPLVSLKHVSQLTSPRKGQFPVKVMEDGSDVGMERSEFPFDDPSFYEYNPPHAPIERRTEDRDYVVKMASPSSSYSWAVDENILHQSGYRLSEKMQKDASLSKSINDNSLQIENQNGPKLSTQANQSASTENHGRGAGKLNYKSANLSSSASQMYSNVNSRHPSLTNPGTHNFPVQQTSNDSQFSFQENGMCQNLYSTQLQSNVNKSEISKSRPPQPRSGSVSYSVQYTPIDPNFSHPDKAIAPGVYKYPPPIQQLYINPDGSLSALFPPQALYTYPGWYNGEGQQYLVNPIQITSIPPPMHTRKNHHHHSHSVDRRQTKRNGEKSQQKCIHNERKNSETGYSTLQTQPRKLKNVSLSNSVSELSPTGNYLRGIVLSSFENQTEREEDEIIRKKKPIRLQSSVTFKVDDSPSQMRAQISQNSFDFDQQSDMFTSPPAVRNTHEIEGSPDYEYLNKNRKVEEQTIFLQSESPENFTEVKEMDLKRTHGNIDKTVSNVPYTSGYVREINRKFNKMTASMRSNSNDSPRLRYLETVNSSKRKISKTAISIPSSSFTKQMVRRFSENRDTN